MNSTTGNESIESSSCFSTTAYKIGQTIALTACFESDHYCVLLTGNSFIVLIVYKPPALRKPINYFIANMAMSDLAVFNILATYAPIIDTQHKLVAHRWPVWPGLV